MNRKIYKETHTLNIMNRTLIYEYILKLVEREEMIPYEKLIYTICFKFLCSRRKAIEYIKACSIGSKKCREKTNKETKEVFIEWCN